MMAMMMMMMVLCTKAGSRASTPHGDEMSEVISRCLPVASTQTIMGEQLVQGSYTVA